MDISKNIEYWSSLIGLNESSSVLLDNLAKVFGRDVVFNVKRKVDVDDDLLKSIFDQLNENLFDSRLSNIPVKCLPLKDIQEELKHRGSKDISERMLGVMSVLMDCDRSHLTLDSKVEFSDHLIMINSDDVDHRSFVFVTSTLCHEMIHLYDTFYGQLPRIAKGEIIFNRSIDTHSTTTFKHFMNLSNEEGLHVIKSMYADDVDMIDYDTMEKMISALYEDENLRNKTFDLKNVDVPGITIIDSHRAVLNVID